ncbi:MAG: hypothetical protein IMZ52_05895 [Actinobacteria bacterium]|nr:hypothetical protein [Actinomycetota bacterium]MBE3114876.1 hypothetical protein [Actinomycetota bacterium]
MKHQKQEVKAGVTPRLRCGGENKQSNNDVFCRDCLKPLLHILNGVE